MNAFITGEVRVHADVVGPGSMRQPGLIVDKRRGLTHDRTEIPWEHHCRSRISGLECAYK